MSKRVKVMVVDDTITYRQILSKVCENLPDVEFVGTAMSGKTALMKIPSLKPDLIFLDVMMPDMDGIETLQKIKEKHPHIDIIMVSAFNMENAKATITSLEKGALDFVAKPKAANMEDGIKQLREAFKPLVDLVHKKLFPDTGQVKPPDLLPISQTTSKPIVPLKSGKFDMVLIGVSTGGPNALFSLFKSMETKLNCPILIVQHMPPLFTQSLAERLNSVSIMCIKEAQDGDRLDNGTAYIAPGGKHMVLRESAGEKKLAIIDSPPVNHCKPAVDVLFRSVSAIKGAAHLSVIMTGMGRDGTEGVKSLKRSGSYCVIQDQASSIVWGMPGSVSEAGLADETIPLDQLGERILVLVN